MQNYITNAPEDFFKKISTKILNGQYMATLILDANEVHKESHSLFRETEERLVSEVTRALYNRGLDYSKTARIKTFTLTSQDITNLEASGRTESALNHSITIYKSDDPIWVNSFKAYISKTHKDTELFSLYEFLLTISSQDNIDKQPVLDSDQLLRKNEVLFACEDILFTARAVDREIRSKGNEFTEQNKGLLDTLDALQEAIKKFCDKIKLFPNENLQLSEIKGQTQELAVDIENSFKKAICKTLDEKGSEIMYKTGLYTLACGSTAILTSLGVSPSWAVGFSFSLAHGENFKSTVDSIKKIKS